MKLSDFHYELPEALIARYPLKNRTDSRLLHLKKSGEISHHTFSHIVDFLDPNDLLVLNDTKVLKARLFGKKHSGGQVEFLLERALDDKECLMHAKANKPIQENLRVHIAEDTFITVLCREHDLWRCKIESPLHLEAILERFGHVPLPPYFKREDEVADIERYQTVFAVYPGAVAAPTAGLHFDEALLALIKAKGVEIAYLTLHVGAGTFKPVKVETIENHEMHEEHYEISLALIEAIERTKARGGRIIACGTTVTRALETWARLPQPLPIRANTNIFIYPGVPFLLVDALITNFHLPDSTLLMLVSAFAGLSHIKTAYQTAIDLNYRFFSFGDAMFIG